MRIIGLFTPKKETGIERNGIAYFEDDDLEECVFIVFWDRASIVPLIEADEETDREEREAYLALLATSEMPESTPEWPPIVIRGWPAEFFIDLCRVDEDGDEREGLEQDQKDLVFSKTDVGFVFACMQSSNEGGEEAFFLVWVDAQHILHLHHFYQRSTLSSFLRSNPLFDRNIERVCLRVSQGLPWEVEALDLELVGFAAMLLYVAMVKEAKNADRDDDTEEDESDDDSEELLN